MAGTRRNGRSCIYQRPSSTSPFATACFHFGVYHGYAVEIRNFQAGGIEETSLLLLPFLVADSPPDRLFSL
jgi:hypothetical protein